MGLQVCEYPRCKQLTLMDLCEEHRHEDFEEDECEIEPVIEMKMAQLPKRETIMKGTTCTKGTCAEEAAEDSVQCPTHRDAQRASNEKFQGREGRPKRKYTRRTAAVVVEVPAKLPTQAPAHRVSAPITLAEPTVVNGNGHGTRGVDLDGNAVLVLDRFIQQYDGDVATLRRAREILARHG